MVPSTMSPADDSSLTECCIYSLLTQHRQRSCCFQRHGPSHNSGHYASRKLQTHTGLSGRRRMVKPTPCRSLHCLGSALPLQGGPAALSEAASDKAWSLPLGAAILGIRQLGLNGWDQQECLALENELGAWQQDGNLSDPTNALR